MGESPPLGSGQGPGSSVFITQRLRSKKHETLRPFRPSLWSSTLGRDLVLFNYLTLMSPLTLNNRGPLTIPLLLLQSS